MLPCAWSVAILTTHRYTSEGRAQASLGLVVTPLLEPRHPAFASVPAVFGFCPFRSVVVNDVFLLGFLFFKDLSKLWP